MVVESSPLMYNVVADPALDVLAETWMKQLGEG
jgi:hypothetical protein